MAKKPQISVETTADFQQRLDRFAAAQPASKRFIVETAIERYIAEATGTRLAINLSDGLRSRVEHAVRDHGLRPEWMIEHALDQFLTARQSSVTQRIVADLSDRVAQRVTAYRRIRSSPAVGQLIEDALDQFIDSDIKYNEDLKRRFVEELDSLARNKPN